MAGADDARAVHLRPDTLVEPLVNDFHAWLGLIAPATLARYVRQSHLPVLRSYLDAPQVHEAAARRPDMRGGPFVDVPGWRRDEIGKLVGAIEERCASLLDLADALAATEDLVRSADGSSLDGLYAQVPPPLRGLVELQYDLNDGAALHLVEEAVYRRHLDRSLQSIHVGPAASDVRPFFLSTPRLPGADDVRLATTFDADDLDALFRAERTPLPRGELHERFGLRGGEAAAFDRLTTDVAPAPPPPSPAVDRPAATRVRYFGHACIVVEGPRSTICVDPFLTSVPGPDRLTYQDLPDRIDVCLVTHGHPDHLHLESLLRLRHRIGTLVVPRSLPGALQDPSIARALRHIGFRDVVEVGPYERVGTADGEVLVCPFFGEHCDLAIASKATYVVVTPDVRVFAGTDASGVEPALYADIREWVGHDVDVALVGMECEGAPLTWLYGPLFTRPVDRRLSLSRRLSGADADRATEIVHRLGARRAHVYAMGREPWLQHVTATSYGEDSVQVREVARFVEACAAAGVEASELTGCAELTGWT